MKVVRKLMLMLMVASLGGCWWGPDPGYDHGGYGHDRYDHGGSGHDRYDRDGGPGPGRDR
ncbi:hypothetical protein PCO31110_04585 [Pandoraea communis]|uniref:Lipoprotein n=1 Tax=Pandoraea communis TaxID=2508297 RepID=A0A5E4YHD0_9BURK|nr:hypothetical protein PCO31110_04585 [Pandoraea communis]